MVELDAVYLVGSAAQGAYEHGRSDVDVIAVTTRPSSRAEKEALAEAAESLPCPARKLELVVYARGAERHELNVNTGELVHFDPDDDPAFWFVLDRSIAEQHAVPLLGPPWPDVFPPVPGRRCSPRWTRRSPSTGGTIRAGPSSPPRAVGSGARRANGCRSSGRPSSGRSGEGLPRARGRDRLPRRVGRRARATRSARPCSRPR